MAITAAQLLSMQQTVNAVLPSTATNSRTAATTKAWVAPDHRESAYPGGPELVPLRRWRILVPAGTDCKRHDQLSVPTMGTYIVVEAVAPHSLPTSLEALAYQLLDASGGVANPVWDNATVQNRRAGSNVGSTRRVRIEFKPPGGVGPTGLLVPDQLWDSPPDADTWHLNDVVVILAIDGYSTPPHPQHYRLTLVSKMDDVIPIVRAELVGMAGADV